MRWEIRSDGGDDRQSLDAILELLSQYQRRTMIRYLSDATDNVVSIDDIIDHLEQIERERAGESPGEDHLLSVLVHIHGPKLEEAGLIEYDVRSRELRYYPNERVETVLERIEDVADDL